MANVIALPFKATEEIPTLAASLVQHITDSDPTTHPHAVQPDAEGLAKQRQKLFGDGSKPLDVADAVLLSLTAYHAQLSYALTKLSAEVPVAFPWHPIFASTVTSALSLGGFPSAVPVALPNLHFERLAVLYNIAAMHSAIGAQTSRIEEEGIKASIAAFQRAAGVLAHLLDLLPLFSPDNPALDPPSPDFSPKAIAALRDVCLAQAQEAFWQKGVMDRLKNGTIAKLAAKVSEYYEAAAREAVEAKGSPETWPAFAFPQALLNHLNIKHLHFAAVAQFRKSIDDLGANRYGDELGRLRVAEGFAKKAMDGPRKGVAESVVRDLKGLQQSLAENIVRADKDNRLIYLEAATSLSSLPVIVPASMVRPTPPVEVTNPLACLHNAPGGLGRPFFEGLVPQEVTRAVRVWEDRKDSWVRDEVEGRRDELDALATLCLESLGLPGSIQAVSQPIGLPPSLLAKAQEVRSAGGAGRVRTMMQDVRRVAQIDQQVLDEALAVLAQEAADDEQHRRQYGTDRWTRVPSSQASAHLAGRAASLGATLEAARASDALVRAKWGEWEARIEALGSDEKTIESSIPSLAAPTLTSTQSSTLTALRTALQSLDDLRTARARTAADARYAAQQDNIRPDVLQSARTGDTSTAQFEPLFEERIGRFARFKREMSESESRQEDALDRIKTANTAFVQSRRNDSVLKKREVALQGLDAAYHKFRELSTNLAEGLKFYADVAGLLHELRDSCKQWAYARNIEGRDQLQALTAQLEGMRLKVAKPGVWDPSSGIRFG